MHYFRPPSTELSRREMTLAQLIAEGHSGEEISTQMGITKNSVKVYSVRIYRKLGLTAWGNPRVRLAIWVRSQEQAK
jgi:DNA-binding NarL/FixJ family response regulator